MIGWMFPSNNFGQENGFNDAGIETFRGNPWDSLAREVIQNSLDAKLPGSPALVEVEFKLEYLPIDQFPDKEKFEDILERCREYWRNNTKTRKFFIDALEVLSAAEIPVLKISDYNTTGLTGSDKEHGTNWHNLIKSVGASDKSGGSGGSYGIGKHAPFACSKLRTVFYGTKDCTGGTAFQGVAKLVTHKNADEETTQGTGYYGIIERNRPILDYSEVDSFFRRERVGTDVFIAGFNAADGWQNKIIKSVLENFFYAVYQKRLVVRVEGTAINDASLPELIEQYINDDPECLSDKYYNALTSDKSLYFAKDDFEGLGKVELFILPEKDYPKRVAMVRGTGMKIFDKGHFRMPMKFAGVMFAVGEKMNEFLRSLEPPPHNNWEPNRHDDEKYAKRILSKLNFWINEQVRSIAQSDVAEELEVEGMSQYLPDDLADDSSIESERKEGEKDVPKEVEVRDHYPEPSFRASAAGADAAAADGEEENTEETHGNSSNDTDGGDAGAESSGSSGGSGDGGGSTPERDGSRPTLKTKPLRFKHVRVFCTDPDKGTYNISIVPEESGKGYISFKIVGEVGIERADIESVVLKDTGERADITRGKVGPIKFTAGQKTVLQVVLSEPLRCALEVASVAD